MQSVNIPLKWSSTVQSVYRSGGVLLHVSIQLGEKRGSSTKSDNLPHMKSLESALVGPEDYKFACETHQGESI